MSAYRANLISIIYKLDAKIASSKRNLYSYYAAAKNYYTRINPVFTKKNTKKIKALLKESTASEQNNDFDKVRSLENYIKTNFSYKSFNHDDFENIEKIIENKSYNKTGIMKLYAACLKVLIIDYDLVLTTDRNNLNFDEDFEAYSFLREELIYIPSLDKYLSPVAIYSRLGYIPASRTENYGLFINSQYDSEVKFIEALGYDLNVDTTELFIDFSSNISKPSVRFRRSYSGLTAIGTQSSYDYIDTERAEERDNDLGNFMGEEIEVENLKVLNKGGVNFGIKPLIVSAEVVNANNYH